HGECRQLEGILMMSDGPEEVLYGAGGMHRNTLKLFDNFAGVGSAEYTAALEKFLSGSISKHSFDDLSLNVLYLESLEKSAIKPGYRPELLQGVTSLSQVSRMSSYAYLLDASLPAKSEDDLSFLR
ncbi:MAG: hypothetical protein IKM08_04625, partial [Clostridia bacterium]|nr:hypothetical protein [Clostridia bacterium]